VGAPQGVADDDHRRRAGAILLLREIAAARRRDAENTKEARRDIGGVDPLGRNGRVLVAKVHRALLVHANAVDRVRLGAVRPERPRRLERVIQGNGWEVVPCANESLGMGKGERAEEHGVDHGENSNGRAEGGGNGDDGRDGEGARST
jgi:hypothetical protein